MNKTLIADVLIYIAGILWGIELIPQIRKTIQTKKVEDLSLAFFLVCLLAYVTYMLGNIMITNWNIVVAHIPSLLANSTMLYLIIKYRDKK